MLRVDCSLAQIEVCHADGHCAAGGAEDHGDAGAHADCADKIEGQSTAGWVATGTVRVPYKCGLDGDTNCFHRRERNLVFPREAYRAGMGPVHGHGGGGGVPILPNEHK